MHIYNDVPTSMRQRFQYPHKEYVKTKHASILLMNNEVIMQ